MTVKTRRAALEEFIRHLAAAVSTAVLYPLEHPQVDELVGAAHAELNLALGENPEVTLLRLEDSIVADGRPLPSTLYLKRFARMLRERGIGHLRIAHRIGREELLSFAGILAGRRSIAEFRPSENLQVGKVAVRHLGDLPPEHLRGFERDDLFRLEEILDGARRGRELHAVGVSEIVSNFIRAMSEDADPLLVLAPLRDMDEYTFAHSINVCLLNLAQARSLGIEGPLLNDIGISALLHDIGKLFIPDEILNKPGKLDDTEWRIIREHPAKGAEYLLKAKGIPRMAVVGAYEHHMSFDGSGYPDVGDHWRQSLAGHMTAISDLFDSMLTRRSYREPLSLPVVAQTIRHGAGTQLHPMLAENFLQLVRCVAPDTPSGSSE